MREKEGVFTSVDELGCDCGQTFGTAGALCRHRKEVHGAEHIHAYLYAGRQVRRQVKLKRDAQKEVPLLGST